VIKKRMIAMAFINVLFREGIGGGCIAFGGEMMKRCGQLVLGGEKKSRSTRKKGKPLGGAGGHQIITQRARTKDMLTPFLKSEKKGKRKKKKSV